MTTQGVQNTPTSHIGVKNSLQRKYGFMVLPDNYHFFYFFNNFLCKICNNNFKIENRALTSTVFFLCKKNLATMLQNER